jgi:hypothetical protein
MYNAESLKRALRKRKLMERSCKSDSSNAIASGQALGAQKFNMAATTRYRRGVKRPVQELASTLAYIPVSEGNCLEILRNRRDYKLSAWAKRPTVHALRGV